MRRKGHSKERSSGESIELQSVTLPLDQQEIVSNPSDEYKGSVGNVFSAYKCLHFGCSNAGGTPCSHARGLDLSRAWELMPISLVPGSGRCRRRCPLLTFSCPPLWYLSIPTFLLSAAMIGLSLAVTLLLSLPAFTQDIASSSLLPGTWSTGSGAVITGPVRSFGGPLVRTRYSRVGWVSRVSAPSRIPHLLIRRTPASQSPCKHDLWQCSIPSTDLRAKYR